MCRKCDTRASSYSYSFPAPSLANDLFSFVVKPRKTAQAEIFVTQLREVPGTNVHRDIDYTDSGLRCQDIK
jgi:hypothetical protein